MSKRKTGRRLVKFASLRIGLLEQRDGSVLISVAQGFESLAAITVGGEVGTSAAVLRPDGSGLFTVARMPDGGNKLVTFGEGNRVIEVESLDVGILSLGAVPELN